MSISKIIYFLGQRLVAASENTWIKAYVSDKQKKQFFFILQKIMKMSKQRTLPNISFKNAWQISSRNIIQQLATGIT